MADSEIWRWIWVIVVAGFLVGEMVTPGTFFFLPFAAGALGSAIAAFAGASIAVQWILFLGLSVLTSVSFIPLRKRLDRIDPPTGVGSQRILHQEGVIVVSVGAGPTGSGTVRIGREQWRAESVDQRAIDEGTVVRVVDIRGTGVIVEALTPNEGEQS